MQSWVLAQFKLNPDSKGYVCAFRGRRDAYQVPLALAEAGLLDQFITDAYAVPWLQGLAKFSPSAVRHKIGFRFEPGIPMERVRCLWGTTLVEHFRHRAGFPPLLTFNKLDRRFSEAAVRRAQLTTAHLFLYSSYAWEALTARYRHQPHKVLFQYHPHPDMERQILAADSVAHPDVGESFCGGAPGQLPEPLLARERDCWKHADLILCASTFTKRSLLAAGATEGKCRTIPYGIDLPAAISARPNSETFEVVFVGSGVQRKGLHHLLLAWQQAVLPAGSKLTIVCRMIDRAIEQLAATTANVELRRGVPAVELNRLYATSSLFAMPSLVEGFGQVYLEALAQGCPVLGTPNTCLPDLGGEADGIFLVAPGNIAELSAKLEALARSLPHQPKLRPAAQACAARHTWPAFRHGIREVLKAEN